MRIAKFIAAAGLCSRRQAERLIEAGRVRLDGAILSSPATLVSGLEQIEIDGQLLVKRLEPARLWCYHKRRGFLTTNMDPQGRPTIFADLPPELPRLMTVGRLDFNSEGLLLLTNDGGLARNLELPATGLERRYLARAHGRIEQRRLDRLAGGMKLDGIIYRPVEARLCPDPPLGFCGGTSGRGVWIELKLTEGKKREVRRLLQGLGLKVSRLVRLCYGPVELGELAAGAVREVPSSSLLSWFGEYISPDRAPLA